MLRSIFASSQRPSGAPGGHRPRARGAGLGAAFALTLATVSILGARPAGAQAWYHPSFQPPRLAERDYTLAVAANAGTSAVFQWREGVSPISQLALDVGIADADARGVQGTRLLVAGQYARLLARATAEQPLDLLLTVGAGIALGDSPSLLRLPVGVSVGHRFPLEGGMAVTPYVHPRLSIDAWTSRLEGTDRTALSLEFDVGASFEITRQLALRGSLLFTGADRADNLGFGLGLTITPAGLRR
jgi:hypothetical protein